MPSDVRTLLNGFAKNPLLTRREGLYFKEKDYKCVRADDYSLYAKNENTGVVVVKTNMYLVVATYTAGMYPSVCVEATEKLANNYGVQSCALHHLRPKLGKTYPLPPVPLRCHQTCQIYIPILSMLLTSG
uniref:Profilin-4 n=1 Tax=Mus spicilegus TaxID=10103 RepID=A0A8C6G708_MUSSI